MPLFKISKTLIMKQTLLLLLSFSIFFACNKDDGITPPEEWTSDDNIFQCKVNGEDWGPEGNSTSIAGGNLAVYYTDFNKALQLTVSNDNGNDINQAIIIFTYLTQEGFPNYKIRNRKPFIDFKNCGNYYRDTTVRNMNLINFSDIDSVNFIMEGTFEFEASNSDCGDTIRVTDGYFKAKYRN
jgi:hypothetical protein